MTIAVLRKVDSESVASSLQELEKSLKRSQGEVVIDVSSVPRLSESALRSLAEFASKADAASVKVILRGVNVDVYKVLVLMNLNSKFSFVN
jgi:anti-anti-sigma regulatory factor